MADNWTVEDGGTDGWCVYSHAGVRHVIAWHLHESDARQIAREHNLHPRLVDACKAALDGVEHAAQEIGLCDCHHFDPEDLCQSCVCPEARELCQYTQTVIRDSRAAIQQAES